MEGEDEGTGVSLRVVTEGGRVLFADDGGWREGVWFMGWHVVCIGGFRLVVFGELVFLKQRLVTERVCSVHVHDRRILNGSHMAV